MRMLEVLDYIGPAGADQCTGLHQTRLLRYDAQMNHAFARLLIAILLVATPLLSADKKILIQSSSGQGWVSSDAALARYRAAAGTQADVVVTRSPADFAREVVDADAVIGGISKEQFPTAKKLKWVQT